MTRKPQSPAEDDDRDSEEPFLRRWARRKGEETGRRGKGEPDAKAEAKAEPTDESSSVDAAPGGPHDAKQESGEAEEPADARGDEDMPPLESIDEGGSVADFFSPRVSRELRRAALRRLFSQSQLPVVDDLDDYAGDYTKYKKLGDLVTNEMRHRLEVASQRLARRAEERLAAADPASVADRGPAAPTEHVDEPPTSARSDDTDDDQEGSEHDRSSD